MVGSRPVRNSHGTKAWRLAPPMAFPWLRAWLLSSETLASLAFGKYKQVRADVRAWIGGRRMKYAIRVEQHTFCRDPDARNTVRDVRHVHGSPPRRGERQTHARLLKPRIRPLPLLPSPRPHLGHGYSTPQAPREHTIAHPTNTMPTYRELQKQCKSLGLSAQGDRVTLEARLLVSARRCYTLLRTLPWRVACCAVHSPLPYAPLPAHYVRTTGGLRGPACE